LVLETTKKYKIPLHSVECKEKKDKDVLKLKQPY